MRLLKYLKSMAKNVLKIFLISFVLFFLLSCTVPATYSRKNIQKSLKDICKNEFNIEVKVRFSGETIWVYAPLEELIDSTGQWNKEVQDTRVKIFLALGRVFLSMDNPPKLYCLLASGIKGTGLDTYTIGYIPDMIKFDLGFISSAEREKRIAFLSFPNPSALSDAKGEHIQEYDISIGEFISYLVGQNVEEKFRSSLFNKSFQLKKIFAYYRNNTLKVNFDIKSIEPQENSINPFDEVRKTIKEILDIYNSSSEITEIEINNFSTGKARVYTPENLDL